MTRLIDPMARARSFAARRGGMLDNRVLRRRLGKIESRIAPVRADVEEPEEWTVVEGVDEMPDATDETPNRFFIKRNDDADDSINVGITAADGTPIFHRVNTTPIDDDAPTLILAPLFTLPSEASGVTMDAGGDIFALRIPGQLRRHDSMTFALEWFRNTSSAARHIASDGTRVFVTGDIADQVGIALAADGSSGTPIRFGSSGSGNGQLNSPIGVVTDGTHVWVADSGNNRIQKFTIAGVYVSQFGSLGAGDGQFDSPAGIALAGGKLYVLDTGNARVQRFDAGTHAHEATLDLAPGNANGQISADAEGIAVDSDGNIWVADTGNHRIQLFDAAGVFLADVGSFGSGAGQLKSPRQIAMDAGDIGYVADFGNDRISTIRIVPPGITLGGLVNVDDAADAATTGDLLSYVGANWTVGPRILTGSTTWNPASVNSNRYTTQTVTVTGVAEDDFIQCNHSAIKDTPGETGWVMHGHFDSTNTVKCVLFNCTGAARDVPSGTLVATVIKV